MSTQNVQQTTPKSTPKANGGAPEPAPPPDKVPTPEDIHRAADFARRRLLHDVAGIPDEEPFHFGYDLLTTLEHEENGGTDEDPTVTLLTRALEMIHAAQELTDGRMESCEEVFVRDMRAKGFDVPRARTDMRRGLAEKMISFAEGLVDHARRMHKVQADELARRVLAAKAVRS